MKNNRSKGFTKMMKNNDKDGDFTMMKNDSATNCKWNGFAASIPGSGHIRRGIPCQDASAVMIGARPAAIVCDGRGSASLSHFGAQGAVDAFRFQMSVLEPFLVNILDEQEENPEQWIKFCRIMYRTLMQVKYDLAEKYTVDDDHVVSEKEFDCTVAFAIAGKKHIGCFQVGDGSIVLRQNGICQTVFPPEKGEYANQTHFLRPGGEEMMKFQHKLLDAEANSGIAITSDGPEHLMFHMADMTPGKIFDMFLNDLGKEELCKQDLMDYLTRREWDNDHRGTDDRSLALLTRINTECSTVPESWEELVEPEKKSEASAESVEVKPEEKPETSTEPVETETNPEDTPLQRNEHDCDCDTPCDCSKKKSTSRVLPIVMSGVAILTVATYLVKQEERLQTKQQTIESQQKTIQNLCNQLKKKKPHPQPASTVQTPVAPKKVQKLLQQPASTVQTPEVPKVESKKSPDITEGA